jgi:hypothetical protein
MLTPSCFPSLQRFDSTSRTDVTPQLTDEQWFLIEELFPWEPPNRAGGRPRRQRGGATDDPVLLQAWLVRNIERLVEVLCRQRYFAQRLRDELFAAEWDLLLCAAGSLSAIVCEYAKQMGRNAIDIGALDLRLLNGGLMVTDSTARPGRRTLPREVGGRRPRARATMLSATMC